MTRIRVAQIDSEAASNNYVPAADGSGNAVWEAQAGGGASITVEEVDGTPSVADVTLIKVTNGKLTDNTGGSITLDLSGGAGAALTVKEEDGTPSVANVTEIKVTNGRLTDNGSGSVSVNVGESVTLASGTYTPTLYDTTNVAASTAYLCSYLRVGDIVHVGGAVSIDPTSAAALVLGISLPIASNLVDAGDLGGAASNNTESARIYVDATNDRALLGYTAVGTANLLWTFTFTYMVK